MSSSDDIFKQASSLFAPDQTKKEWYEELEDDVCSICPSLTYQQRIIGCLTCMGIGFLISLGSTFRLVELMHGDPEPFALMYTFGNIMSISSTCFLYGPLAQCKSMFAQTRLITTSLYIMFMAATLFFAFYPGEIPMRILFIVFCIIFQFLALSWYTLSFIPFARDIVKNALKEYCCPCFKEDKGDDYVFWSSRA